MATPPPQPSLPAVGDDSPVRDDSAIASLEQALRNDPTDSHAMRRLAQLHADAGRDAEASHLYRLLLAEPERVDAEPLELATLFVQAAQTSSRLGQPAAAHRYYRQAYELAPDDDTILAALAESAYGLAAWDEAFQYYKVLAARDEQHGGSKVASIAQRLDAIRRRQTGQRDATDSHQTLHAALDAQTNAGHWPGVLATLERLVQHEQDPVARAKYRHTAGLVYRDMCHDPSSAITLFQAALDDDPTSLVSFQAIDRLLTADKDWAQLERAYRRMLARVQGRSLDELELFLWRNLAEIYRSRLHDYESAIRSYEVILARCPDDASVRVLLVELYDRLLTHSFRRYAQPALREHTELWRRHPNNTASLQALYEMHRRLGATDKAYCIASALTLLHRSSLEQADMVSRYRRASLVEAQGPMSESFLRGHILHPQLDPLLTQLFGVLAPAVGKLAARRPGPAFATERAVDLRRDTSHLHRTLHYVARCTGLGIPEIFINSSDTADFTFHQLQRSHGPDPVLALDLRALQHRSRMHLAFALGREFFLLYPPFRAYWQLGYNRDDMRDVLVAGLSLGGAPIRRLSWGAHRMKLLLRRQLDDSARHHLRHITSQFVRENRAADLGQWAQAIELSALRLGLVLCGDVSVAAHVIAHERSRPGLRSDKRALLRELVLFSVSEEYFSARERVGIRCLNPRPVTPMFPVAKTSPSAAATPARGLPAPRAAATPSSLVASASAPVPVAASPFDPAMLADRVKRRAAQLLRQRLGRTAECSPQVEAALEAIVYEFAALAANPSRDPSALDRGQPRS